MLPTKRALWLSIGFLSSFSFRTSRISARRRPQTATVVITTARLVAGTALMRTATKQKEPWFEIRRNGYGLTTHLLRSLVMDLGLISRSPCIGLVSGFIGSP